MTDTAAVATVAGLTDLVERYVEQIINIEDDFAGAATPAAGELPCGYCEGTGQLYRDSDHPLDCYVCDKKGQVQPPDLGLILSAIYTDHGGNLRPRKGYGLSPRDLHKKGANRTTIDLYTFIRAHLQFDLGKNVNLGGLIMNEVRDGHPFKRWAKAVNVALMHIHGRDVSAGALRWAQAMGRV